MSSDICSSRLRGEKEKERVRGIEPPCAAWEAAVLPLNYTREEIFDFRFAIADCNRNKFALQIAVRCAVLSAFLEIARSQCAEDSPERFRGYSLDPENSLPRNHVVGIVEIRTLCRV